MPQICRVKIKGISPYSSSRMYDMRAAGDPNEPLDEIERKNWRLKCNVNRDGYWVIPAQAIKQCLDAGAKRRGIKKTGRATWTKHFTSGVAVMQDASLGVLVADLTDAECFIGAMSSEGKKNGGRRVIRYFPQLPTWQIDVEFVIYDAAFDNDAGRDAFLTALREAGTFVGLGRWRPENQGNNGRFVIESHEFKPLEII